MVVAAADAAGTFQFALVHEHDIKTLLLRADGRAAAGSAGTYHEHVGFNQRAERMRRNFHQTILYGFMAGFPPVRDMGKPDAN